MRCALFAVALLVRVPHIRNLSMAALPNRAR